MTEYFLTFVKYQFILFRITTDLAFASIAVAHLIKRIIYENFSDCDYRFISLLFYSLERSFLVLFSVFKK